MRVLFYLAQKEWSATARVMLAAARGLSARGHVVAIACCGGSRLESESLAAGIDTVLIGSSFFGSGGAWDLRKTLQAKFIEVAIVTNEDDHKVVSSSMRFADRGAVLRRLAPFDDFDADESRGFFLKLAPSGLLVSTNAENDEAHRNGWAIRTQVAPLGVDAPSYDAVDPAARDEMDVPSSGLLIVCSYDATGSVRVASLVRAMALLASRHAGLHAVVIGPDSDDDGLQMRASALGVGRMMTFLGDRSDARRIMRAADVGWVVASGDDAAMSTLDFMALRVPVVSDRTPLADAYVVDGSTGCLLESDDPAAVAASLAVLLSSRERRIGMGNAARMRVQNDFSESSMIDGYERAVNAAGDRSAWRAS